MDGRHEGQKATRAVPNFVHETRVDRFDGVFIGHMSKTCYTRRRRRRDRDTRALLILDRFYFVRIQTKHSNDYTIF